MPEPEASRKRQMPIGQICATYIMCGLTVRHGTAARAILTRL